jgi:ubiquinone/menaquinone biosynthesis C-methylase UbiE
MISVAQTRTFPATDPPPRFAQGDATRLHIDSSSTDVVTQVFGIGGIPQPDPVFTEALRILRPGGEYYLVDMHRPIPNLPGEVPFGIHWLRLPLFEAATYTRTTMPLALARLWGWRDTTMDFYRAPLAIHREGTEWFGFETQWFKHEAERWWFGLPVMPTARLLLRKVKLPLSEVRQRQQAMETIPPHIA